MRMNLKKSYNLIAFLTGVFLLINPIVSCASEAELNNIRQQQSLTQNEINNASNAKEQAEKNLNNLKNEKDALQNEYNANSSKLNAVNSQINSAKKSLASTAEEISVLSTELQNAKSEERSQYELMKLHIKYMYEHQNKVGLLVYMLNADSMKDFLTRTEYVNAIMENDDRVITAYHELVTTISSKSAELAAKEEELSGYSLQLEQKQAELDKLTNATATSLNEKTGQVENAAATVDQYEAKLAELDTKMKSLESQAAAAQAAIAKRIAEEQAAAIAAGLIEDTSGAISYGDYELVLLAATIEAEAGGEPYEGKLAVGSVIMNRVLSSYFPNSVSGVVSQSGQFSSYTSGKVNLIAAQGPKADCMQAATQVLNGYRLGNWLFFMRQANADSYGITGYVPIGNHVFFYKWGAN